jgi:peroxiredoxin family protein
MSDESLSLVLFSGTADKLHAAATLAAGASAMGRPVNVLLQYWALDAFRSDRIDGDHGLAFDAMAPGSSKPVKGTGSIPWLETFRMAKELGEVSIQACSGSLETLGVDATGLDPLVDGPCGIATFLLAAEDGQILFI